MQMFCAAEEMKVEEQTTEQNGTEESKRAGLEWLIDKKVFWMGQRGEFSG